MTIRSVTRVARLVGFVVSPLLTAPAAGADLEREALAPVVRSEAPAALRAGNPAVSAARDERRRRRATF